MSVSLGQAILELAANTARFTSDLGRALSAAEKFKRDVDRSLKTVGATLSVAAFGVFIKKTIDAADRLNDLRTRTGQTGQELLVMEGAAVRSGVELDAVGDVASKLSRRLEDARKGTGDAANAFAAMGIKVTDSSGRLKNVGVILAEVGEKFKGYEDGANKSTIATAALGKGGDRLIPFVEALKETEERFKKLGITISEDVITRADEFNDKVEDMKSVSTLFGRAIIAGLLPHLNNTVEALLAFSTNGEKVRATADALATGVKVLATGFVTLAGGIAAASRAALINFAVLDKLRKLNFAGAVDEFNLGIAETKDIFETTTGIVSKLWATYEEGAKKADKARKDAPSLPDLAAMKKAQEALEKLLDARAKLLIDSDKDVTEKRLQLLDKQYSEGLVAERDYWSGRLEMQRDGLASELRTLDEQITRQTAQRDKEKKNTKEYYDAQRELEETIAKRAKLEGDVKQAAIIGTYDAAKALRDYQDGVAQVGAEFDELAGHTARALDVRQQIQNRALRQKMMTEGDEAGLTLLNGLEKAQRAQASFNETREEQELIGQRLQIQEERIQNTLRTGAISEFESLTRTSSARRDAADQMERFVRTMEQQAAENPMLKSIQIQAEQARAALDRLRSESDLLAEKFNGIIKDSFSDAFSEFINGTMTARQAFESFAKSVIKNINDILAKNLAQSLYNAAGLGGAGGGIGGWLSRILTGGGSGPTALPGPGAMDQGGFGIDEIARRFGAGIQGSAASGLDFVPRTGAYLLHQGEAVLTKDENAQGRGVTQIFNITTPDADSFRRTRRQIASEFAGALG